MTEIEISGNQYQVGRLDAFKQFHVARRLAPVLKAFGEGAAAASGVADGTENFGAVIGPVADVLSKMSDQDTEYVLHACLSVCKRKVNGVWTKVYANGGGLMYQDITMAEMVQLTVRVVQENLGDFFPAPQPQASPEQATGA